MESRFKQMKKYKIIFTGTDFDMGHYYNWSFSIDEIRELEPV